MLACGGALEGDKNYGFKLEKRKRHYEKLYAFNLNWLPSGGKFTKQEDYKLTWEEESLEGSDGFLRQNTPPSVKS